MAEAGIRTIGTVGSVKGPGLYSVALKNGKIVLAHLSRELERSGAEFSAGDRLLLEMTPFDFDIARILGRG